MHTATWTMSGTVPNGTPIATSGLSVATLRLQADDSWKIMLDNPFGVRLIA